MDFDWSYEMPGYDAGNLEQYDYDAPSGGFSVDDYGDTGGGAWMGSTNFMQGNPGGYEMTNPGSMWAPPSMGEPTAPSVGQPGPGPRQEDDWMTQLKKAGLGMGVGLGTQVAGAGLKALMTPGEKKQSTPLPPAPGRQYTPEPLEDLPGTKASPLISGRPTQVIGSQGLKGKRAPSYGGFSMY